MHFSWQAWFFITLLLFSGLLVSGLITPSFAVQPIPNPCTMHLCKIGQDLLSPFKQLKAGISLHDVKCNDGLVLVIKTSDNSPACVKPDTAQKLVERGWGVLKEQMVWFVYNPMTCQQTPWVKWFAPLGIQLDERGVIKDYFERQGITILDAREIVIPLGAPPVGGKCSSSITYYFLVPDSDVDKMTNLGYKILTPPLAPNALPIQ